MKIFRQRAGQAAVETAIVLPLHIFLLLAIIQWGLIAQARAMAKYAAYRAVRVGAMQHADKKKMIDAAVLALLPVISESSSSGIRGAEIIKPTQSAGQIDTKFAETLAKNTLGGAAGLQMVDVVICGPLRSEVASSNERNVGGQGDTSEVDFDDPRVSTEGYSSNNTPNSINNVPDGTTSAPADVAKGYAAFLRTKLRIQLQFMYRMPIPFANWIISASWLGLNIPSVMHMNGNKKWSSQSASNYAKVLGLNAAGIYVVPMNVNYAFRMQSDFYLSGSTDLPGSNTCIHYK